MFLAAHQASFLLDNHLYSKLHNHAILSASNMASHGCAGIHGYLDPNFPNPYNSNDACIVVSRSEVSLDAS